MSKTKSYLRLLRPASWTKNLLVFAALVFSGKFVIAHYWIGTVLVFGSFCCLASSIYVLNDWIDREQDRLHPKKSNRPLASGDVSGFEASVIGTVLVLLSVTLLLINPFPKQYPTFLIVTAYGLFMLAYNLGLKDQFGLDVLIVASGYVFRAAAGGTAINVPVTGWFILTIFFLCLLLILGKRRAELNEIDSERRTEFKPVLESYSKKTLDRFITISASASLITYTLYTLTEPKALQIFGTGISFSVIFVIYGIFRYLHIVFEENGGGAPEQIFLNDRPIQLTLLVWLLYLIFIFLLNNTLALQFR